MEEYFAAEEYPLTHDGAAAAAATSQSRMKRPRQENDQERLNYERMQSMYDAVVQEYKDQKKLLKEKDAECCMLVSKYQEAARKVERLELDVFNHQHPGHNHNHMSSPQEVAQYNQLKSQYQELRQSNAHWKAQVLEHQRGQLLRRKKVQILEHQVSNLQEQLNQCQLQLGAKQAEHFSATQMLENTRTTLMTMQGQQNQCHQDKVLDLAQEQIRKLREEVKKNNSTLYDMAMEKVTLTTKADALKEKVKHSQEELVQMQETVLQGKTELASCKTLLESKTLELTLCQVKLDEVTKALEDAKEEMAVSHRTVRAKTDALLQCNHELEHALQESYHLRVIVQKYYPEMTECHPENATTTAREDESKEQESAVKREKLEVGDIKEDEDDDSLMEDTADEALEALKARHEEEVQQIRKEHAEEVQRIKKACGDEIKASKLRIWKAAATASKGAGKS